jgi:hypothetical protein
MDRSGLSLIKKNTHRGKVPLHMAAIFLLTLTMGLICLTVFSPILSFPESLDELRLLVPLLEYRSLSPFPDRAHSCCPRLDAMGSGSPTEDQGLNFGSSSPNPSSQIEDHQNKLVVLVPASPPWVVSLPQRSKD